MEPLPYEALPQREPRVKRRRGAPAAEQQPEPQQAGQKVAHESQQCDRDEEGISSAATGAVPDDAVAAPPLPARAQGDASTSGGESRGGAAGSPLSLAHIDLPEYRTSAVAGNKFEYLDHTADVQLHAWGATLEEAFANTALAMFNYMTPLEGVGIDPELTRSFEVQGHDMHSVLFAFLDELLFTFATELLVCREVVVTGIDRTDWRVTAVGRGERFVRGQHEAGTEVKAITYSAMQVNEAPGDCEVFVIVDI